MDDIARVRRISSWASRVFELGPHSARGEALSVLGNCNRRIERILFERGLSNNPGREREEVERFLDVAARNILGFCVENLIQAPPGLHGRLMRRREYRSRVPWMRAF